jgi:uncharacterized protein
VDGARLVWSESVPADSYATRVLGRGTRLRFADPDGGACAHLLLFRADAPWERLNVADTMKVPWQAYLSVGHPLLSDQGPVNDEPEYLRALFNTESTWAAAQSSEALR